MRRFEVGHCYEDGDRFDPIEVLRRTEKFILVTNGSTTWRMRIRVDADGNEYVEDSSVPKSYRNIGAGVYSTKWEIKN